MGQSLEAPVIGCGQDEKHAHRTGLLNPYGRDFFQCLERAFGACRIRGEDRIVKLAVVAKGLPVSEQQKLSDIIDREQLALEGFLVEQKLVPI